MRIVLGFEDIDGAMVAEVGGKAANLGVMTRAELPVPRGFCVTTDAYREVAGQLLDDLYGELSTATETTQAAQLAEQSRDLIVTAAVPVDIVTAVQQAYARLGSGPVAVRSSATAEDLDFASFAGQQDTYLNVQGDLALLDAVRRCWASLWTDRAVSYRNTHSIDHATVALAVVVQEMVDATAAGVMFTANPVTGTRHQTVIDASTGLGESVVSGAVNPDHFVVDTTTQRILERRLGDKRVLIRSLAGGGTERVELDDSSARSSLTDAQVLQLTALGSEVQGHYGSPQDTEWALDESGRFWLTQARPITTLYPLPDRSPQPGTRVYLCMTLAQGLTRPITPVGLAAFRLIGSSISAAAGHPQADVLRGPEAFTVAGQRVFVDFTGVLRSSIGRRMAVRIFGVMEARAAAVIEQLYHRPEFAVVPSSSWDAARRISRIVRHVRVPQRAILAAVSPARAYRAIDELEHQLRHDLEVATDATPEQRLDHVQDLLLHKVFWCMPTVIAYPIAGFALLGLARRLLRGRLQPGELQVILRGLPHNVTTEMDLELWQVSQAIGADPEARSAFAGSDPTRLAGRFREGSLPPVAHAGLTAFLVRHGHRAVAEIDLGMPRWSDDPTHLIGVLSNYLRLDDPALAPDVQFRAGSRAAETKLDELAARAGERSAVRARVVRFGLRRARQLAGLREAPKNLLVLALAGIRAQIALVGEALAAQGRVEQADDAFFLDFTELRRGLAGESLQQLVRQRRDAYAAELERRHIPRVLLSDGTEPEAVGVTVAAEDGSLLGSPASAGTVTARARVILDPVGARLEPGEILVAPSTDPGWTPLFLTAGGLVMEMGGSNSHGAVVAREYGIPAVVGVPDATSKIQTGDLVTLDGASGVVRVVDPEPAAV